MIDPVQLVVSVVGVTLIVMLVWAAAGWKTASVGDAPAARERISRELPGFAIGALVIDSHGRAAMARSSDGAQLALLFATGQRVTCWQVATAAIRRAKLRVLPSGSVVLEVETGDFTRGRLSFELADRASAAGMFPGSEERAGGDSGTEAGATGTEAGATGTEDGATGTEAGATGTEAGATGGDGGAFV